MATSDGWKGQLMQLRHEHCDRTTTTVMPVAKADKRVNEAATNENLAERGQDTQTGVL